MHLLDLLSLPLFVVHRFKEQSLTNKTMFSVIFSIAFLFSPLSLATTPDSYEDALKSFHANKYDETIIHLKNALRDNIVHIPSRLLLAETLIAQGQGAMAETELADLQAEGVDVNQLVVLRAQALLLQNKHSQLLSEITPGYRGNIIESKLQLYIGRAYLAKNRLRDAETAFITALDLAPEMQLAKLGRAQVALNKNQLDRAMAFVDDALTAYEPIVNAWVMKANIAQLKMDHEMALMAIEKALKIKPNHIQARLYRASILISQQKHSLASDDLDFILDEIPQEPRAKYLKAIVNASEGNSEEGAEKLAEVVETLNNILPEVMAENPSYYYLAGLTNFQYGNIEDAERYLHNFLAIKEFDLNALRLMAMVELRTENYGSAKTRLTKANIYFPNNVNVLTLLGITSMKLKDFDSAQRYFEKVVTLTPDKKSDALQNLARSKMATGDYQEAITHLLSLNTNEDENKYEVTLLLVESYLKSRQFDKAKDLTLTLAQQYPQSSFIAKKHAVALGLSGDAEQARAFFEKALALNPNDLDAAIHLVRMDVVENKVEQALAKVIALLEQNKGNLLLQHELADIYARTGEKLKAHTWYEKAYANNRENEVALSKLISSFIEIQQLDKAIETLENYIRVNNNVNEERLILGQLYLSVNQPQKSIKLFQRAIKSDIDKARVYMLLTKAYLAVDDRDAAALALTKAIAWDETRIDAIEMLFTLSLQQNDVETADKMIAKVQDQLPKSPLSLMLAGKLAMHLKQFKQAETHYQKAYKLQASQNAVLGLYNAYAAQGKYPQARKAINNWLQIEPFDVIAEIAIAESYVADKNNTEAIKIYESLLIKYRRMPIILNNLANVYHDDNNIQKALILANEAYKKAPQNVSVIDSLAWFNTSNGDYDKALPLLREALVLDFKNPEVKYHLAVTLDKEKRRNEAKKLLIEAVQSERDFTEKAQAKALLDSWLTAKK